MRLKTLMSAYIDTIVVLCFSVLSGNSHNQKSNIPVSVCVHIFLVIVCRLLLFQACNNAMCNLHKIISVDNNTMLFKKNIFTKKL